MASSEQRKCLVCIFGSISLQQKEMGMGPRLEGYTHASPTLQPLKGH